MKLICPDCKETSEQEEEGFTCSRCLFNKTNPHNVTLVRMKEAVKRHVVVLIANSDSEKKCAICEKSVQKNPDRAWVFFNTNHYNKLVICGSCLRATVMHSLEY